MTSVDYSNIKIKKITKPTCNNTKLLNFMYQLFNKIITILKQRLNLFVWQGFFKQLTPIMFKNNILIISAPSTFQRDWIKNHYIYELIDAATIAANKPINIDIICNNKAMLPEDINKKNNHSTYKLNKPNKIIDLKSLITKINSNKKTEKKFKLKGEKFLLNTKYSFNSFIEGPSNKICIAAGYEVVENPGTKFSPLFLFGSVGIGKTHLLHAIGLAAKAKYPGFRVLYVSAEQWVNSYITAIRKKKFDDFRKQFRTSCDMLLVDDIQFLEGKEASQDEFFHTFNALHNAHKQIVVTSDKYPHEIIGFNQRLKTRLSWGLFADILPPEFSTRLSILQKKNHLLGLNLSQEILHFIAEKIPSSIRELEGALSRLFSYTHLIGKKSLTLSKAKIYLAPFFKKI